MFPMSHRKRTKDNKSSSVLIETDKSGKCTCVQNILNEKRRKDKKGKKDKKDKKDQKDQKDQKYQKDKKDKKDKKVKKYKYDIKDKTIKRDKKRKKRDRESDSFNIVIDEYCCMEPERSGQLVTMLKKMSWDFIMLLLNLIIDVVGMVEKIFDIISNCINNCTSFCRQILYVFPYLFIYFTVKLRCIRTCNIFQSLQACLVGIIFLGVVFYIIKLTLLDRLMFLIGYSPISTQFQAKLFLYTSTLVSQRKGLISTERVASFRAQTELTTEFLTEIPSTNELIEWDENEQAPLNFTEITEIHHVNTTDVSVVSESPAVESESSAVVSESSVVVSPTSADVEDADTTAEEVEIVLDNDDLPGNQHLVDIPVLDNTSKESVTPKKSLNLRQKTMFNLLTRDNNRYFEPESVDPTYNGTVQTNYRKSLETFTTESISTSSKNDNLLDRLQNILHNKLWNMEQITTQSKPQRTSSENAIFHRKTPVAIEFVPYRTQKITFFAPIEEKNVIEKFKPLENPVVTTVATTRYIRRTGRLNTTYRYEPVLLPPDLQGFGDF